MAELKLALTILAIVVSGAIVGALLGQIFPHSSPLYVVPVALGVGISIRLISRHLARKREN